MPYTASEIALKRVESKMVTTHNACAACLNGSKNPRNIDILPRSCDNLETQWFFFSSPLLEVAARAIHDFVLYHCRTSWAGINGNQVQRIRLACTLEQILIYSPIIATEGAI